MLLIVPFLFMANPKNFHTWLLAPDRGFSHTSAVSNLAMVQHSMFDPLHADKQKLVLITHAEYLYCDSDMALCIYQYRWFIVQLMVIHIDISIYWYVSTSLTSTLQKFKLAVLDWTLAAVQLVSTSMVVYNLPVWSLSCLCQWSITVKRGHPFRLLSSHDLAFQSPDSIVNTITHGDEIWAMLQCLTVGFHPP